MPFSVIFSGCVLDPTFQHIHSKMKNLVLFLSICVSVVIVCSAMLHQEPPEDYVPSEELCWEHPRDCSLFSGGGSGIIIIIIIIIIINKTNKDTLHPG